MSDDPELEALLSEDAPVAEPVEKPKRAARKAEAPNAVHGHAVLSDAEVEAARKKARDIIEQERKDAALAKVLEAEKQRLRTEEGLVTGDGVKDEMVKITLDLAEHSDCIRINGREYHHGFTYDVPRHVADTLRDIQSRGHAHQNEIEGKSLSDAFRRPHNTGLSPITGVKAAPQPVAV